MNKTPQSHLFVNFKGITFDDVLLLPNYSQIKPSQVDLTTQLTPHIQLKTPIISIHMDTVTEEKMAIAMAREGGLGIIHRNQTIDKEAKQVAIVKSIKGGKNQAIDKKGYLLVTGAIGVGSDWQERAMALVKAKVDALVIDVSHAHKKNTLQVTKKLRSLFPHTDLIVGNIATAEGAKALTKAGAQAIKVGIGNGTICTLRIVSGVGVPQITAVLRAVKGVKNEKVTIISDGGTKTSGDIVKALASGAGAVAVGSQLAGCKESPGKIVRINGKKYKQYRGMGSSEAMGKNSLDRYYDKKVKKVNMVSQGVVGAVPYLGSVRERLFQLIGGIKSGFGYVGALNIKELHKKAKFIQISNSSLRESHPFNIIMTKDEPNYKRLK